MQDQAKQTVFFVVVSFFWGGGDFFPGRTDYPYREEGWRRIVAGTWWLSFSTLGKYWQRDNRPA